MGFNYLLNETNIVTFVSKITKIRGQPFNMMGDQYNKTVRGSVALTLNFVREKSHT